MEKNEGFRPDLILGHTGWGELLFMKQIRPDVPIPGFFEYFHNATGGVVGFYPDNPVSDHTPFLIEIRNAVPYANIEHVDPGHVPTVWQKNTFPTSFHPKLYTCHDGIRTDRLGPDPDVSLSPGRLDRPVTRGDEVFTCMARNPEHVRGFHIFMAALPRILAARPGARVPVAGAFGARGNHPWRNRVAGGFP